MTGHKFRILSIALQLIHGATENPPRSPSLVFPAGDLLDAAGDDARCLGRLFLRLGVRGQFLCRVPQQVGLARGVHQPPLVTQTGSKTCLLFQPNSRHARVIIVTDLRRQSGVA